VCRTGGCAFKKSGGSVRGEAEDGAGFSECCTKKKMSATLHGVTGAAAPGSPLCHRASRSHRAQPGGFSSCFNTPTPTRVCVQRALLLLPAARAHKRVVKPTGCGPRTPRRPSTRCAARTSARGRRAGLPAPASHARVRPPGWPGAAVGRGGHRGVALLRRRGLA
jgi:hypothetical protein